jgi:excisionase family DNA binding protein
MFKLIGSGEIESVQIGRLRRVKPSALDDYVSRLSAKQGEVA